MTSPDLARAMLFDAPNLNTQPGLVAALQSGRANSFQVRAVGQFVQTLEVAKQVQLARASGGHLSLSPADKSYLDTVGQPYDDVDAARLVTHPVDVPGPGQAHGFWASVKRGIGTAAGVVTGGANLGIDNPVTQAVLGGLDRAADVGMTGFREASAFGVNTPFTPAQVGPGAAGENVAQMRARGYDSSNFFDVLNFYSHGEQVYADLTPLREQYGSQQVNLAARFATARGAGDEEYFKQLTAGMSNEAALNVHQQLNDPGFQRLVEEVDAHHLSPGRDLARSLGLHPGQANVSLAVLGMPGLPKVDAFKVVSGSMDAAAAWFADPTLVLGKAAAAYKTAKLGLDGALDVEGINRIMDPGSRNILHRQVQSGWKQLLDDATIVRTGTDAEKAAAMARVTGRTPELVPLVGEITGKTRVLKRATDGGWVTHSAAPITTMDELTAYLVDKSALLRVKGGLAASENMLMPGAISRFGYRQIKGATAGKLTERGLNRHGWIDVREDPAQLIPTPGNSAGSAVPDDVSEHLQARAAARGDAIFNERRYGRYVSPNSRAGRSLAFYAPGAIAARFRFAGNRLSNLLPRDSRLDYADPNFPEQIRRFALTYMPKSEANLLAASAAGATEAERMTIARGVIAQTYHAAGYGATVSGRKILDEVLRDLDGAKKQVYSPHQGADLYGQEQHAALWDGQLDTGIQLPAFSTMQHHAAKASVWDFTMRSPLNSQWADDLIGILKPTWITTGSNMARNVLEDVGGAALRGQGGQLVKARSALALRNMAIASFDSKQEAASAFQRSKGRVEDAFLIRHALGAKASAHLGITDEEMLRVTADMGQDEVKARMNQLAGDAHKAILSPGEADIMDEITRAGYSAKDLRVKLEPGGYKVIPADGGKGARAWSMNLASRLTGSGMGEHAVAQLLDPTISREEAVTRHADWLASDAATEFRERAQRAAHTKSGTPIRGTDGAVDPDLERTALHELAADQLDDMHAMLVGRDGNLIEPLAQHLMSEGRAPSASWIEQNIPDEQRPAHAVGKTWIPAVGDGNARKIRESLRTVSRVGYELLVDKPITVLSRNPIYMVNLAYAKRNLAGYAAKLELEGMTAQAARSVALDTAAEAAFHATVKQIDDPGLRTQMDVVARNFFAFSRATQDFLRRWGRTFREDPSRLRKAQLTVEAGVHSGFVDRDSEGNLQFTYPGSGAAISALTHAGQAIGLPMVALPVQPNLSTKLVYLNAGLDNPLSFTVTPLVSTPLNAVAGWLPGHELGDAELDKVMRGELGAGRPAWESFMPSVARRMWRALDPDERDSQAAAAGRNAILALDAAGLTPGPDATQAEIDTYIQRVRTATQNQMVLRAIFGVFAPGTPSSPEQSVGDANAADPFYRAQGINTLTDEMRKMVNDYGYQKASVLWAALHPDKLGYLETSTTTAGQNQFIPATAATEQWMQDHKGFLKANGAIGGYFIPTDPGEFSPTAWQAQLEMGLRKHKTLQEFYTDVRVSGAERTYYAAKDARDAEVAKHIAAGDEAGAKAIKANFSAWSQGFLAYNPLFAQKQATYGMRQVTAERAVAQLRTMLADPSTPALPELPGVQDMVDAYAAHTQFSAQLKGQRSAEATAARASEISGYEDYQKRLVQAYPGLQDLYNGVFRVIDSELDYLEG
jgi:hypothetical protein